MVMILTNLTPICKKSPRRQLQTQWQVSVIQTICAQHTMRKPVRPLALEWNRDNLMIQHQVISLNGRLEKSECKWPKSKGFNFSCREFYLVEIKRQWRPFEEFVWIPTKAERRTRVGLNRKRSDLIMVSLIRLKGYWTGGEIKLILFVFTFLYRWDGGGE